METITIKKLEGDGKMSSYTLDEYKRIVKEFHGSLAPGLLIGAFMVDLALKNLPAGQFFDAIVETKTCLPDAVQLLTPCTVGNGWLRVMNFSRFAITIYEKEKGEGVRVYIDSKKIESWPEVRDWFFKRKPKKEQNYQLLLDQIVNAGPGLCSMKKVVVKPELTGFHRHGSKIAICASCGEAFNMIDSDKCPACRGEDPYLA